MKFSALKQQARYALANKWGFAVLVTLIYGLFIYFVPEGIKWVLSEANIGEGGPGTLQLVSGIISILLAPLTIGFTWYFMDLFDGGRARWTQIFETFDISIYPKMLGTAFLIALYSFLWSLLFIIPGIIKSFAYSQTYYVLKDQPELTINQAITRSRELMVGYKWKYFLFTLSFIGWAILAAIPAGMGFLWLVPYYYTSCVAFYRHIASKKSNHFEQ